MKRDFKGIWIPIEIWDDKELNHKDKMLLGLIVHFEKITKQELINASKKYLKMSSDATHKSLKKLTKYVHFHPHKIGEELVLEVK